MHGWTSEDCPHVDDDTKTSEEDAHEEDVFPFARDIGVQTTRIPQNEEKLSRVKKTDEQRSSHAPRTPAREKAPNGSAALISASGARSYAETELKK